MLAQRTSGSGDRLQQLADAYALDAAGDAGGAEALVRAVLRVVPQQPMALHLLGVLLLRTGRAAEALTVLASAAALRPDNNDTVLAHADALSACGDHTAALPLYGRVLQRQPHRADALVNCARAQSRLGRPAAAADSARAALAAVPGCAPAHAALGAALLELRRPEEALAAADAAVALDPALAEAWFVRGTALSAQHRDAAAIGALERAVALRSDDASAWLNLGNAHACCDDLPGAERDMRRALSLDANLPEAHASLAWLLTRKGRLAEAVAACDAAIRLRPGFARAHWNRATAHLLAGDFAQGWEDYEWRRHPDLFADTSPHLPGPQWQGEDLAGRHLLVVASQGMGDTIQCARFLPLLAVRAARVTFACPQPLLRLLRQLPVAMVPSDGVLPPADFWVDQMSLPRLLRVRERSIPGAAGYLQVLRQAPAADPPGRRRVGVAWAGNPAHPGDARRSMKLASLAPLFAAPDIDFVSLQVGREAPDIEPMFGIADAPAHLRDFAATARLMATLDLVVCVDTAVAHLAGALGVPVWIMLPHAPDWRWILGRDDTPWYASARLFRQGAPGDWAGVVARVAEALIGSVRQECGTAHHYHAPAARFKS